MTATDKPRRFSRLKLASILIAVPLLLLAIIIALLPQLAAWAVSYSLQQQGYQTKIGQLDLDLLQGRISGKTIEAYKPSGEQLVLANLELTIDWQALSDRQLQLLNLNIEGLQFVLAGAAKQTEAVSAKQTDVEPDAGWLLGLQALTLKDSTFCTNTDNKNCLTIKQLEWRGNVAFDTGAGMNSVAQLPLTLNGKLVVNGVNVGAVKQSPLVSLQQLSLATVKADSLADIQLQDIRLQEFAIPRPARHSDIPTSAELVKFNSLEFDDIRISSLQQIELGKLTISGLGLDVLRQQDGGWEITRHLRPILPQQQPGTGAAKSKPDKPTQSAAFKIGQLVIEQSENISFEDRTLATPFSISVQQFQGSLSKLDSSKPQQATEFSFDSVIEQHGMLKVSGMTYPFRDQLTFSLQGKMTGIDLRPATSYLERYLGYRVKSGQISGDVNLAANAGKLDGVANVELQKFYLTKVNEEQAKQLAQQLGSPLTAALALLREKDKSIRLKIPVSGDVTDPQFSQDDAIRQLLSKAIAEAVSNYYTDYGLSLAGYGQYGLAIKGASKLYGFLTKLRFNDIAFAPGQHNLGTEQNQYLDEIGKMLISRPEVHLTLCGFVTPTDLLHQESWLASEPEEKWKLSSLTQRQREKLLQLANQRAAEIKTYLVSQWSIKAERLIVCEPEYDANIEKLPRVELSI